MADMQAVRKRTLEERRNDRAADAGLEALERVEAQVQSARDGVATALAEMGFKAQIAALRNSLDDAEAAKLDTRLAAVAAFVRGG